MRDFILDNTSVHAVQAVAQLTRDGGTPAPGVVVVATKRLFCQALAATVRRRFQVLGTGSSLSEAEQVLEEHQPQLSLLAVDPPFPNVALLDTCKQLIGRYPMTHALLVFREPRPEDLLLAYQQGARGMFDMTISADQLIDGLERLASGEVAMQPEILHDLMQTRATPDGAHGGLQLLTATQTRTLALLSEGYTSKEIARVMHATTAGVNHTIERAAQRLGARHRAEAVARALRLGIIT